MAPGNKERHPGHTGTIPKTKARNNCNVPQEAVTPTRRDMTTNLVTTSLDWVPVSEYNTRANCNSRKPTNNTSDQELADLDNSVTFESGFGRFVPVRPQPRALPLTVQNRENISTDHNDDGGGSSISSHTLHHFQNGLNPHSNHAAAAVMIVNPTTPNAVTGNMSQSFNAPNQNRNNLARNLNSTRNTFDGNTHTSNNNITPPISNSRTGTKTVNLMNNMYDQGQGSFNNLNEHNQAHRESARALGEAIVAACPDAASVERRLGQIREYIRVTSSLVDTMRNSEDEDVVVRPVSVQSNGSAYSENELWQNEIKNKMEMSQKRLIALKQQQKRLLKYQAEAKQQLEEMKERQAQEIHQPSANDNFSGMQNISFLGNYNHPSRMYGTNQIGVATTLPQSSDSINSGHQLSNNIETHHGHSIQSTHSQEERFSIRDSNLEASGGGRDSEGEEDEGTLHERGQMLQLKLRELQLKKQHMENLVSEFQKLQMATGLSSSHNTYSSSGEDSAEDDLSAKCNKSGGNLKNEDPFKLLEIKAIKTALQKTKDLMRSVETFETDHLSNQHEEAFPMSSHSNIHDNKSEGGGSMGGWSNEGSVCRVRNSLSQRQKFTNEQQQLHQQQQHHQQQHQQHQNHHQPTHQQQQHLQQLQQHQLHEQQHLHQQQQQASHEANIASLQDLAQELRMETEKIIGERARIKDMVTNKELSRKQKKVNEEVRAGPSSNPGPAERRQMQLRALLADKQRELEALLNKEKMLCVGAEGQKSDSRAMSVVNQSYNSEQEEPESRSEQLPLDLQISRDNENYRGGGDSVMGSRSINTVPSRIESTYGSDTDSASKNKANQRNRPRRRQTQDRQTEDNTPPSMNTMPNIRIDARPEISNINMVPPVTQNALGDNQTNIQYGAVPSQSWNSSKSNQDMRTNQFTQNSHSQTMERLMGTPQMAYPPTMPYNMMMPYGMMGGCSCGCGFWGAWCWQQLAMQQREIQQLRDQLNHLEERWRAETSSHTLNNQVPPGNRANNYWDNFRSYSRQNLLSTNSKTNADGHLGTGPVHNPHPLVERSHNTLHHTSSSTSPSVTPKRNTNTGSSSQGPVTMAPNQVNNDEVTTIRHPRRNVTYERSLSFSSAPDVLNLHQNTDAEASTASHSRNNDENTASNINLNRQETATAAFRNLNITNPIPEIIQSHSNNLNNSTNSKKKSSSKLPSKNSTNRRNYSLELSQNSNFNIASTSETPNPNLASTSREVQEKATSKLFDLLRENVYSEVTTLIGVNESHPDFLIQLFRELQLISSEPLRQRVLQSIRNILSQYSSIIENQNNDNGEEFDSETVTTTTGEASNYHECNPRSHQNACTNTMQIDNKIVRFLLIQSEEICTSELLETLASLILNVAPESKQTKKKLLEHLSKYEGSRVCDMSSDVIENLSLFISGNSETDDLGHLTSEISESSILQDVAGSLNLFSASETQLHQINACPYEMWPGHVHMDIDGTDMNENGARCGQDDKVDLINCSEMHNGDLAEADQTCHVDVGDSGVNSHDEISNNAEGLPDVVDTDEVTPTEAEAEWLGLDRVPTRLHMGDSSEKQKD